MTVICGIILVQYFFLEYDHCHMDKDILDSLEEARG